jgi:D-specific alpha-keto acid dehydrogenase
MTPGITVYGCDPDEAAAFRASAPRLGVVPSITSAPVVVVDGRVLPVPGNRCISVAHTDRLDVAALRALCDAGVEHLSSRSIGLDHIDIAAAEELGIAIENAPYAPDGVADFTLMLLLSAVRPAARGATGRDAELRDLIVGVVGAGRIGSAVIERLRGFGCRIVVHDPRATIAGVEQMGLSELLETSDVVTLHLPLRPGTRHLIAAAELARMPRGAVLVNTARGDLVEPEALVAALASGHLAGAALDVDLDDPRLLASPHVIATPHVAYRTQRALRDTVEQTLLRCLAFERTRQHA